MNIRTAYAPHVRFALMLKRRAREMRQGRHDETNAIAMHSAALHIADMARQLMKLWVELEALKAEQKEAA